MQPAKSGRGFLWAIAVGMFLVFACADASWAQLPGAIFTTNANGTRVNQNIYPDKCAVYLDGGPGPEAPAGAAGLPEGDYYFQVTDPSGKVLLSTDPVSNRRFHVSADGVIVAYTGVGGPAHPTGVDTDHAGLGAITIQLANLTCPTDFLDTPNPGGVYKAWVTPVDDFVGDPTQVDNSCGRGCFHGFVPSASKTDNFKVGGQPLPCLTVRKFIDANGNGKFDFGEELRAGWPILIFDPLGAQINGILFTTTKKDCTVFQLVAGTYRVVEFETDGTGTYIVTANILDGHSLNNPDIEVLVRIRNSNRELIFGNAPAKEPPPKK